MTTESWNTLLAMNFPGPRVGLGDREIGRSFVSSCQAFPVAFSCSYLTWVTGHRHTALEETLDFPQLIPRGCPQPSNTHGLAEVEDG